MYVKTLDLKRGEDKKEGGHGGTSGPGGDGAKQKTLSRGMYVKTLDLKRGEDKKEGGHGGTWRRWGFGLWSVRFPPVLVRTGRRPPVQAWAKQKTLQPKKVSVPPL